MTEESAEYACGQILFNLKSSNLHYLVKETSVCLCYNKKKVHKTSNS